MKNFISSMTYLTKKNIFLCSSFFLLLFLPFLSEIIGETFLISLFSRLLIYGIAAVSLDLIIGYGGMVSLGHAAFFGLGAYVVGIFSFHSFDESPLLYIPWLCAGSENALFVWPLAILITAILAFFIGLLSLRTTGMHFIMITLAFAQMIYYFFISLETYGGDDGLSLYSRNTIPGLDLSDDVTFYYICLFLLMSYLICTAKMVKSRFGMVIRGCKENEKRMKALGFNTYIYKLVCFTLAGAGAGLAGALIANQTEFVSPGLMHWTVSGELMVMVILGGLGTVLGPVIGAITLLLLEEFLAIYTEHWMVYLGPFLIFIILFAKSGIYGLFQDKESSNV